MTIPTRKTSWGKIFGTLAGLFLAGPKGAIIGFIIGLLYDVRPERKDAQWSGIWSRSADFSANREQAVFTMGIIVLGAKMAKSDGRVTRAEIEAFKRVFHIAGAQEDAVGQLFDQARRSAEGFEPYAFQLAHVFRRNPDVLEEVLTGLFIIASADTSLLRPTEVHYLRRVAFIFGFDNEAFIRIAARSGVKFGERDAPQATPEADAFTILGVKNTDSPKDIKKAYHDLIRKHHPDKLMAQGMAPEFIAVATEKMKRINVAYDKVCRIRGIK